MQSGVGGVLCGIGLCFPFLAGSLAEVGWGASASESFKRWLPYTLNPTRVWAFGFWG